jgi:hypothetical protein
MIVLLGAAVLLSIPVIAGLVKSRREQSMDRQHFSAFVGFSAATIAITLMTLNIGLQLWLGPARVRFLGSFSLGSIAVFAILQHLSTLVAVVAGFLSAGGSRIFLVVFGPVMLFFSILLAFSNFGA